MQHNARLLRYFKLFETNKTSEVVTLSNAQVVSPSGPCDYTPYLFTTQFLQNTITATFYFIMRFYILHNDTTTEIFMKTVDWGC